MHQTFAASRTTTIALIAALGGGLLTACSDASPETTSRADSAAFPSAQVVTSADSATGASTVAPPPASIPGASRDSARRGASTAPIHQVAPAPVRTAPTTAGPRRVTLGDIDLTGIGYDRGSATAPVVMIDLSDFSCPYCGKFSRETWPTIERDYVKTGKVFFKYVPFVAGGFPNSREATRAVECAADQGGFWRMMELVYEAQGEWRRQRDPYPLLSGIASVAGLDTAQVGACYASKRTDARTDRASSRANDLGVRVTPSFIVDERPIQGALPLAEFRKVLDAALLVRRSQ